MVHTQNSNVLGKSNMFMKNCRSDDDATYARVNFILDDDIAHTIIDNNPVFYACVFTHFKFVKWNKIKTRRPADSSSKIFWENEPEPDIPTHPGAVRLAPENN
jgi:hypothetical protein